ncbi:hypothetical protein DFH07DRAFT_774444 [Mycena maculata]|uniref:Uncharacterized protein n=1 Tax=Mycena maculata TaxID=230809 RepID=A0AAD7NAE8_9AGAR|nr:hypothetical protein DFH07DRAFT_774444 [Mycena maculata]
MVELDNVEFLKAIIFERKTIVLVAKYVYDVLEVFYATPVYRASRTVGHEETRGVCKSGLGGRGKSRDDGVITLACTPGKFLETGPTPSMRSDRNWAIFNCTQPTCHEERPEVGNNWWGISK